MKDYQASDIRNFAVVGHGGSGKTMLTEALLACTGAINRMGKIESGNTVSDYHEDEKEREISIHASIIHTSWMDRKLNIIDTPGYLDFISDGLGALRVGDFALVVVDAARGVELGTRQVWRYATQYDIPKLLVINGVDKENVDLEAVFEELRENFGHRILPMNYPINPGPGFNRLVDTMRTVETAYGKDQSPGFEEKPAEGEWLERVRSLHKELVEFIAEADDTLLEKYFEQDGLSEEDMRAGLHGAVQNEVFIPCFFTSAEQNVGVTRLLDFIAKYGSSPVDRKTVPAMGEDGNAVTLNLDDPEPVLYVFKTISEPHVGDLSFFRLYSGSIRTGLDLYNATRDVDERIGQIYLMRGRQRESVDHLNSGDIGAIVKLKDTHTGDTLCKPGRSVQMEAVSYPKPNIHAALSVDNRGDEERISNGLATLHEEDPTFLYRVDDETKETVISGQGELHLQVICEGLRRRFNVAVTLREPRVPFRETIRVPSEAKYRHKKQSGGAGQFAEVWMRIKPGERDSGILFKESLVGQNVDRVFVPSVEKGVKAACLEGVLAGYRVVDLEVDFYDGKMHTVDSKDIAFQIAGKEAFIEAFKAAQPCLLEPILNVKVMVPDNCLGDVMGDISGRRGRILGIEGEEGMQVIRAHVPQVVMYRYSTTLRSLTQGTGIHEESLSHYEQMPPDQEQRVIEQAHRDRAGRMAVNA